MPSTCLEEKLMCYVVYLFLLIFHVAGVDDVEVEGEREGFLVWENRWVG